jgi:DNA-directed RNA polymerase subunit L
MPKEKYNRGIYMKIAVLERKPNELKIEIEGEGHTFCNVLQKMLLEDAHVEIAGYNIPHPLTSNPIVYVRTKGKHKPEAALQEAAKKIMQRTDEFMKSFEKALEKWKPKEV